MVTSCIGSVIQVRNRSVRSPIWGQDFVPDSAIFHMVIKLFKLSHVIQTSKELISDNFR